MSAKETGFVSCVVYVHNNEKELEHFLETVYPVFERQFSRYEFLFVDDDSSDKSADIVRAFFTAKGSCAVTVVSMGYYHGTEMAMAAGTDLAIGDFIYEFDCVRTDYPPELIADVFRKMLEGYDIVGAHPSRSGNWKSSVFYKIFNHFSKADYDLQTERFRVLSRRVLNRIDASSRARVYRKALYATSGLKVCSVTYENRVKGGSVFSSEQRTDRVNTAIDTLILFTDVAYKVSLMLCMCMLAFMLAAGGYTVVVYFSQNRPVEGWAPLMGILSAGFAGSFLLFAFVIKYLEVALKLIFQKQQYMVAAVEKIR